MKVQGQFQMSSQSQVSTDDLLVLHFILQSLDGIGSPARLLYQYMQGFNHPRAIIYEEFVFNMETHEQVINHGHAVNDMTKHHSSKDARHVVIFITNHCHDISGDLFVSPGSCATVTEVSESLATLRDILIICPQFMGALLPNDFATFLHGKEVTVWMMSCGALVSSPNSYAKLAAQVQRQVTALVLKGKAESTYSFSDSMWQI